MSVSHINQVRTIPPALIKAYRQAHYIVDLPVNNFDHFDHIDHIKHARHIKPIQIGQHNSGLAKLMADVDVTTAAYLTAFNPYSEQLSLVDNEAAQQKLISDLTTLNVSVMHGEGRDAHGKWPAEPSLLALGISLQDAEVLADRYGQNAFVWIANRDCVPHLRLRYPIGIPSNEEAQKWISLLPDHLRKEALTLSLTQLAWVMSAPDIELDHWLDAPSRDLSSPWPLAKPDGSAMGVGTELDRVFRFIAAGIVGYSK